MDKDIKDRLRDSVKSIEESGNSVERNVALKELYAGFDKLQSIELSGDPVSCKKGCALCCHHWVEDVYSFEIDLIVETLKKKKPDKIERILKDCQDDEATLISVVEEATERGVEDEETILNLFYQKMVPCPLLSESGECTVYDVRPLTCRSFFSREDTKLCHPDNSFRDESATFLIPLGDELEDRLDNVHIELDKYETTGLRSTLIRALV